MKELPEWTARELDPDLVDGEGNPVEVGIRPLENGSDFDHFVTEWEVANGSAHARPYTFAVDYAAHVTARLRRLGKPPDWKRSKR